MNRLGKLETKIKKTFWMLLLFLAVAALPCFGQKAKRIPGKTASEKTVSAKQIKIFDRCLKNGFVVLKDGTVYFGSVLFRVDPQSVRFQKDGALMVWTIQYDEMLEAPENELRRKAIESHFSLLLKECRNTMEKGEKTSSASRIGQIEDELQHGFGSFSAKEIETVESIRQETAALHKQLSDELAKENKALYQGEIFPKESLQKHLAAGEIRLKKKYWLNPSQICETCKGSEMISCPECSGAGKFVFDCTKCSGNGSIKCEKCSGTGKQPCSDCKAVGTLEQKCPLCGGEGIIYRNKVEFASDRRYASAVSTIRLTCTRCFGNGSLKHPCQLCRKTGFLACPPRQKCNVCGGSGKEEKPCSTCSGSGKIFCDKCGSKGYVGTPSED